jgi:cardiolipin synthase
MSLSFANKVTIFRILSVPIFIVSVIYYNPQRDFLRFISLGIFSLAVLSDVIDGYIARRWREKTKAGAILDPIADKLLIISAFICLYLVSGKFPMGLRFPLWFVLVVVSRDAIILLGAGVIYITQGDLEVIPTKWGKATTFFQVLSVIGIFFQFEFSFVIWYLAVVFTAISGIGYLRRGVKILNVSGN